MLRAVVLDHRSGRPLARTRVNLEPAGGNVSAVATSAYSDSSGQCVFSPLAAGAYLLTARRPGYAVEKYGQRRFNGPGTAVVLQEDTQFLAEIRMRKLGVITGEVRDENQVGIAGQTVYAYKAGPRLKLAAGGQSDDRGVFRIAGLEPGRYLIRTAARDLEGHFGLLPTFFGQTTRAQDARAVDVGLDEEMAGIGIQPLPGRLSSLAVTLAGPTPASLTLIGDTGKREASLAPGGSTGFDQLAPGPYDLIAESTAGPLKAARLRIFISKESEHAVVELQPAPSLRMRCEEKYGNALDTRSIAIFVRRKEPADEPHPRRLSCGEQASLSPGLWEVAAAGPPDSYVASLRDAVKGGEAYEVTLEPGGHRDVTLVFGLKPGSLTGVIKTSDGQTAPGAPVFLNALDPDLRSRLGGVRQARADQNGQYRFTGLPPGRYEVLSSFAVQDPGESDWTPGWGEAVTVEEGSEATVNVVLADSVGA